MKKTYKSYFVFASLFFCKTITSPMWGSTLMDGCENEQETSQRISKNQYNVEEILTDPFAFVPPTLSSQSLNNLFQIALLKKNINEINCLLKKCVKDSRYDILNNLASNKNLIAQILSVSQEDPSQIKSGISCLKIFNKAAEKVIGTAPLEVRIGYQCLKYTIKGLTYILKKSSNCLQEVKLGTWITKNGNNVAHLAAKNYSPKLTSWCIINCHPDVFTRKNTFGYTPCFFAKMRKDLFNSQKEAAIRKGKTTDKYQRKIFYIDEVILMLENAKALHKNLIIDSPSVSSLSQDPFSKPLKVFNNSEECMIQKCPSIEESSPLLHFGSILLLQKGLQQISQDCKFIRTIINAHQTEEERENLKKELLELMQIILEISNSNQVVVSLLKNL